jgi:hypothetical protein
MRYLTISANYGLRRCKYNIMTFRFEVFKLMFSNCVGRIICFIVAVVSVVVFT